MKKVIVYWGLDRTKMKESVTGCAIGAMAKCMHIIALKILPPNVTPPPQQNQSLMYQDLRRKK
jgi:hypothetical protein